MSDESFKDGENKHHLFSYYEIKYKLLQIYGIPKNDDEHKQLQKKIREVWYKMPKFKIKKSLHSELHKDICPTCGICLAEIKKRSQRA